MKRLSFVLIAAAILISVVLVACNGSESGKITDTTQGSPVLTTVGDMMSEAASDLNNMLSDNHQGNVTSSASSSTTNSSTL